MAVSSCSSFCAVADAEFCRGSEAAQHRNNKKYTRPTNDEWCPARGVVVVVNVRGTRGDHLVLMSSLLASVFCEPTAEDDEDGVAKSK